MTTQNDHLTNIASAQKCAVHPHTPLMSRNSTFIPKSNRRDQAPRALDFMFPPEPMAGEAMPREGATCKEEMFGSLGTSMRRQRL